MNKTIGIFAHVDAGKTTLSGCILVKTGMLSDELQAADRMLDDTAIERQRGITVFSSCAPFCYRQQQYTLLDTPGHIDFSTEAERCMAVLDCAVLLVDAVDGVQGHTVQLWRLLEQYAVPVFFFINKIDREGADILRAQHEIQKYLTTDALELTDFVSGHLSDDTAQALAERDEILLEQYLETHFQAADWLPAIQDMVKTRRIFPLFSGSALTGLGVNTLLDGIHSLLVTTYEAQQAQPFCAQIYQVRHDAKGNRVAFLKILSGSIKTRDSITLPEANEKINEIRIYTGARYQTTSQAYAGQLCAVTGLRQAQAGQMIGAKHQQNTPYITPVLCVEVLYPDKELMRVREVFALLRDEEPTLCIQWDSTQLTLQVMGEIQLEILQTILLERFKLTVQFGARKIRYQETLQEPVNGVGHFEPLRHYAEVWLRLSPAPRGSGITFQSICPTDVLAANWQNLIETHVFEKQHIGVLIGAPITDIEITLLTGRAHLKHTEGGDFRQAVYRAIRQGLASGNSLLLEPYYTFHATVPVEASGRLLSDITRLNGTYLPPQTIGDSIVVQGSGPAACFLHYAAELPAYTHGRGSFSVTFGGYAPCHNTAEIVAASGYDFNRDTENSADSIFCSHGAGYPVKWDTVPTHAHCTPPKAIAPSAFV